MENQDRPLPINLVSTKELVDELQGRFDVFVAAGVKVKNPDDVSFQFGIRGSVFDVISMLEFLKVQLVMKQIEEHDDTGNGTSDFD